MKKCIITGSNGYLGRNFLKKAIKKGHKIFAVTRKRDNEKKNSRKQIVEQSPAIQKRISEILRHQSIKDHFHLKYQFLINYLKRDLDGLSLLFLLKAVSKQSFENRC